MYTIIDIETTGGNNKTGRITEIAAFLHDGHKLIDTFSTLINPGIPIPPFIKKLTGISNEMVADAPTFEEIAAELDRFTANAIFVAHNVNFDYSFIKEEFRRIGKDFKRKTLCTVRLSRLSFPGLESYSLGKITKQLNIKLENAHRAEADARATMTLFEKIISNETKVGLFDTYLGLPNADILKTPLITSEYLQTIPDECGVVRFYDRNDELIYVKRSPQILTAITTKLRPNETNDYRDFINRLYRIDYEITGSGLVAQLMEANDVLIHKPRFNHGRFSMKSNFGLYLENSDRYGEILILERRKNKITEPIVVFGTFYEGFNFLKSIGQKQQFEFKPELFHNKKSPFIRIKDNDLTTISNAIIPNDDFVILDEAATVNEQFAVLVKQGMPRGYSVLDANQPVTTFKDEDIDFSFSHFPEMEMVIRAFLSKKRFERIIRLNGGG